MPWSVIWRSQPREVAPMPVAHECARLVDQRVALLEHAEEHLEIPTAAGRASPRPAPDRTVRSGRTGSRRKAMFAPVPKSPAAPYLAATLRLPRSARCGVNESARKAAVALEQYLRLRVELAGTTRPVTAATAGSAANAAASAWTHPASTITSSSVNARISPGPPEPRGSAPSRGQAGFRGRIARPRDEPRTSSLGPVAGGRVVHHQHVEPGIIGQGKRVEAALEIVGPVACTDRHGYRRPALGRGPTRPPARVPRRGASAPAIASAEQRPPLYRNA